MLPSVLARQVRRGIEDFLRTTFPIHTPHFDGVLERLLDASSREIFTPGIRLSEAAIPARDTGGGTLFRTCRPLPPTCTRSRRFSASAALQRARPSLPQGPVLARPSASSIRCWITAGTNGVSQESRRLLIYPMNALATDQAKRFARVIDDNARCAVRCT